MQQRARALRQNSTGPERKSWELLRDRRLGGFRFRRQRAFGDYVVDFYCPQCGVAVEVDGLSHMGRAQPDNRREQAMGKLGLKIVRVTNDDVLANPEAVAEHILRMCRAADEAGNTGATRLERPPR